MTGDYEADLIELSRLQRQAAKRLGFPLVTPKEPKNENRPD